MRRIIATIGIIAVLSVGSTALAAGRGAARAASTTPAKSTKVTFGAAMSVAPVAAPAMSELPKVTNLPSCISWIQSIITALHLR